MKIDYVAALKSQTEQMWINDKRGTDQGGYKLSLDQLSSDWNLYKKLGKILGVGESLASPFVDLDGLSKGLMPVIGGSLPGKWFGKMDSQLAVAGSVKARGGFFEVLVHAQQVAEAEGLDLFSEDPIVQRKVGELFSQHTISVGSTGNLGFAIGNLSRVLGFKSRIYMSAEAENWKIKRLRDMGCDVEVVEEDYTAAVAKGRSDAAKDQNNYFLDDENSQLLFRGYATAAMELKEDLDLLYKEEGIPGEKSPIFVYLPCGVGSAPAGIAAGLRLLYGDRVVMFTAEPTQCASVLLAVASGKYSAVSVYEYYMTNDTIADGLACAVAGEKASRTIAECIDGCYTAADSKLAWYVNAAHDYAEIKIEPSAAASIHGPYSIYYTKAGFEYLKKRKIMDATNDCVHISWFTGGGQIPKERYKEMLENGNNQQISF